MTDITFDCPQCGGSLAVDASAAGRNANCPHCKQDITIPANQSAEEATERHTRACPCCGEQILTTAIKCKHCGEFLNRRPVAPTTHPALANVRESEKRILPLFLLAFFLGALGIHAFYAGRPGQGVVYILLLCTSWLGIPLIALAVFLICDWIRIVMGAYVDGDNMKITKWT